MFPMRYLVTGHHFGIYQTRRWQPRVPISAVIGHTVEHVATSPGAR